MSKIVKEIEGQKAQTVFFKQKNKETTPSKNSTPSNTYNSKKRTPPPSLGEEPIIKKVNLEEERDKSYSPNPQCFLDPDLNPDQKMEIEESIDNINEDELP